LLKWLKTAHVQQFWDKGTHWTKSLVLEKYGTYIDGYKLENGKKKQMQAFIIYLGEKPIGYIQFYDAYDFSREEYDLITELGKIEFAHIKLAAIDIFIGEKEVLGGGIGSSIIKQFLDEHVFAKFDACLVDPDKTNRAAIRAYEKAGFIQSKECAHHVIMIASKK
jgi:aminoglycoside 6'-N-acetyltransferase